MKIQIKSVFGNLLFEGDFSNFAEAVASAIKSSADLSYADLRYADLSSADLSSADLSYANLRYANLRYADLSYADLSSADLSSADLSYANLRYANLRSANLRYAKGAELAIAQTRILPEGDLVGWKKCAEGKIVKLLIPADAKRSSAFGRKCRAEFAKVLEINEGKEAFSIHDSTFIYKVGKIVKPIKPFSDNWMEECESGIHFYITKIEAENHD